jgi:hypothetical protein
MSTALRAALTGLVCALPFSTDAEEAPSSPAREMRMQKLEEDLKEAWTGVMQHLNERDAELVGEYDRLTEFIKDKGYTGNLRLITREWDMLVMQHFDREDGREPDTVSGLIRFYSDIDELLDRHDLLSLHEERIDDALIREAIFAGNDAWRLSLENQYRELLMTDESGQRLGLFPEELAKDPTLTAEQYMDMLTKRLKTPQDIVMFLRLFFKYTLDTDDVEQPLKKGTRATQKEYWQTPTETLVRVENNRMLGDCDDVSLLCNAILTRMGKQPVILYIHGNVFAHFICVWLEQRNGRYILSEIDTNGWHEDGKLRMGLAFGQTSDSAVDSTGHDTAEQAMLSGIQHFKDDPELSLSDFDTRQPRIQLPLKEWQEGQTTEDRIKRIEFDKLMSMLTPPAPIITAGAAPPPPPEE